MSAIFLFVPSKIVGSLTAFAVGFLRIVITILSVAGGHVVLLVASKVNVTVPITNEYINVKKFRYHRRTYVSAHL